MPSTLEVFRERINSAKLAIGRTVAVGARGSLCVGALGLWAAVMFADAHASTNPAAYNTVVKYKVTHSLQEEQQMKLEGGGEGGGDDGTGVGDGSEAYGGGRGSMGSTQIREVKPHTSVLLPRSLTRKSVARMAHATHVRRPQLR